MSTRQVTGNVLFLDATAAVGSVVTFRLERIGFDDQSHYMPSDVTTTVQAGGNITPVSLWASAEGGRNLLCIFPNGYTFRFMLQPSATSISLETLHAIAAIPEPEYPEALWQIFGSLTDTTKGSSLVGFLPAGAGAVGRTVQAKLRDTVNAADYGLSTSTTAAQNATLLQAAIDAVALAGGGTLWINAGTFPIGAVRLKANVHLRGAGIDATVLDFNQAVNGSILASGDVTYAACISAVGAAPTALPALASNVAANATTLTFATTVAALLVPGDVILLHNAADYSYSYHRPQYRAGEMLPVVSVSTVTATLGKATYAGYIAAAINAYRLNLLTVGIEDLTITCKTEASGTDPIGIFFKYCRPTIRNVKLSGTNWSHIGLQSCYDGVVDAIHIAYYSTSIGLNYGISLWNSQRIEVRGGHCRVSRHALNFGGSDTLGVPYRDIVATGGIWDGNGVGSVGAIGMHGNGEHVRFSGCRILNSIALAGNHISMDDCTVRSGPSGTLVYAAEMSGADYTIRNCDLYVMAPLLSVNAAVVGAINLVFQPDCIGGVVRIENVRIDMGGNSGYPLRLYHNGAEGDIDLALRNIDIVNMHPSAATVHWLITGIAGAVYRRIEIDNVTLNRGEIRLSGTGASLMRLVNVRSYDAPSIPVYITPNATTDPVKLVEVEVAGVLTTLTHVIDEDTGEVDPDLETFTLANANDKVYFGYPVPFSSVALDFTTSFNTNAATLTWQYWNGTAWAALSGVTDGTVVGAAPFAQDGTAAWTVPGDWAKVRLSNNTRGATRLYFVRAVTSAALTMVRLTASTIGLTTPVTAELIEAIGCHLRGASSTGLQIQGTSAVFTQIKVSSCNLTNNGSNPAGSSSAKASFYITNANLLEVENTWLGDTRAPSGTSEAQTRLWVVDTIGTFYEHDNVNINPAGLITTTETSVTNRYSTMDSGRRVHAPGAAAPTTGTWRINDIVWNTATPTVFKNISHWTCTVAGTPGTWTAHGRGRGTTAQRPTLAAGDAGFAFWDVTLAKFINFNGTSWDV